MTDAAQRNCLLRLSFEGADVCTISKAPDEALLALEITSNEPTLVATNSAGASRRYDIAPLLDDVAKWLHFSFKVNPSYGAQFDCLISETSECPTGSYAQGKARGIRFQPFLLPESSQSNQKFVGRGLNFRGLHFPGVVTPGNLSFICLCDNCERSFGIDSYHAGFGNVVYLYCDRCPNVLLVSDRVEDAPALLAKPDPQTLQRFESRMPACTACGGRFAYFNPFRCAHCASPFIDFQRFPQEREAEYYASVIRGRRPQVLKAEDT